MVLFNVKIPNEFNTGKCKKNERYAECPIAMCQPQTCDELGYPVPCPGIGPDGTCPGEPGCICIAGYVRNKKGKCVPKKQCRE